MPSISPESADHFHHPALCVADMQAAVRQMYGEQVTLFDRITDGAQSISRGDIVKLNCKPSMLGRVMFFSVPSALTKDGSYSYGQVTIMALPEAVFGPSNRHTWPIRRLDGLASEQEVQDLEARELKKVRVVWVYIVACAAGRRWCIGSKPWLSVQGTARVCGDLVMPKCPGDSRCSQHHCALFDPSTLCSVCCLQLPNKLLLEPLKLNSSAVLELPAGSSLPESAVSVLNGNGHKVCRAFFDGQKQPLRVVSATGLQLQNCIVLAWLDHLSSSGSQFTTTVVLLMAKAPAQQVVTRRGCAMLHPDTLA
jgi:hypothetical protein